MVLLQVAILLVGAGVVAVDRAVAVTGMVARVAVVMA